MCLSGRYVDFLSKVDYSTIISSVIGFVGIAYVFCDFCNFQLGIFKFGKVPWLLGIIISVAAFAAYYHMILNKFLAGVFWDFSRRGFARFP